METMRYSFPCVGWGCGAQGLSALRELDLVVPEGILFPNDTENWERSQTRMAFFPQSSLISATQRSRIGIAGTRALYSAAVDPLTIDSVRPLSMGLLCPPISDHQWLPATDPVAVGGGPTIQPIADHYFPAAHVSGPCDKSL